MGGGGLVVGGSDLSLWHVAKFDIFVKKFWTFWKHLGKGYKITFALNSLVSFFCFSNLYCLYCSLSLCTDYFMFTTLRAEISHAPLRKI